MRSLFLALLLLAAPAQAQVTRAVTVYNGNTSLGLIGKLKFSSGVCASSAPGVVTCTVTATSIGNFSFSANVMDLASSGTMTLGSTNTTGIHFAGSGPYNLDGAAMLIDFSGGGPTIKAQGAYQLVLGGGATTSIKLALSIFAPSGTPGAQNGYSFTDDSATGMFHYIARGASSISWAINGTEVMALNPSLLVPSVVAGITGDVNFQGPVRHSAGGFGLTRTTQSATTYSPGLDGNNFPAQTVVWMTNVSARTVTIPTAASYQDGAVLIIVDAAGTAGSANVSVARSSSDTINGGTGTIAVVTANFAHTTCTGNGVSAWICGVNN